MQNHPFEPLTMQGLRLRLAQPADVLGAPAGCGLMELEALCFAEGEQDSQQGYLHKLQKSYTHFFVLEEQAPESGRIVGHLVVEQWPLHWEPLAAAYRLGDSVSAGDGKTAYLESIALHPDWQARGVAELLLRRVLHLAHELGCIQLVAAVRTSNCASRKLLNKMEARVRLARTGFFPEKPLEEVLIFERVIAL